MKKSTLNQLLALTPDVLAQLLPKKQFCMEGADGS